MIPSRNELKQIEVVTAPSRDYRMELSGTHVTGTCDGPEAMKQAVFCILNTERYKYPVYGWNYGIELVDLYGQPADYVMSELKRRITEALTQDDRIHSVDAFEFETRGGAITVFFTVHTAFGEVRGVKRWE